jgi:hypothetical protein
VEYRSLVDVASDANLTYRQADHWVRAGYVHTLSASRNADGDLVVTGTASITGRVGSGHIRALTIPEARVLTLMARMVRVGLTPAAAAITARPMIYTARPIAELGEGLAVLDVTSDLFPTPEELGATR